jgi:phosphomannomutase
MAFIELQNGSDIRGYVVDTPGHEKNIDSVVAFKIGYSFVTWLREERGIIKGVISVGRDPRDSGIELGEALVKGLYSGNAHMVYDFGLASTPAMFISTQNEGLDCDGAIMITASHLPRERNGFKFFTKQGGLGSADIARILEMAEYVPSPDSKDVTKTAVKLNFIDTYARTLIDLVRSRTQRMYPLNGVKVVVDAGNGSGGFFADKVLAPLGADTSGSVYLDPDPAFPNHVPNPENDKVIEGFCEVVKKTDADLGIIFDTDVDRAAIVDKGGVPIVKSKLIALLSSIILLEYPSSTVVTDSVTSKSLKDFIEARGGTHHRYRRGYNNVITEAIRLNNIGESCHVAIETSGHCALSENRFQDDGAYLAVKLLIAYSQMREEGMGFGDMLKDYVDPSQEGEIRIEILSEDFKATGDKILSEFERFCVTTEGWSLESPNFEGVRVNCDSKYGNGWLLMRMSLHDPQIAINVESEVKGGCDKIITKLGGFLKKFRKELKIES